MLLKLLSFDSTIPSRPQDKSKAIYYKRQGTKDITVDWQTMDADSIIALINACNPWNKGAVTKTDNKIIRLVEAEKFSEQHGIEKKQPGTILSLDEKGMSIAALHNEIVNVRIVYADEGFLHAVRLNQLGISPGKQFQAI